MSWRDSLRPASWRGLAFYVEGHEAGFGRRQVTHEFPQRDEPFTEDLGRRAREYSVDAYLLGDDYPEQKQKLIEACETDGPGELVHPYLGSLQVVCTGLTVSESSSEGRICKLRMTFVEAGEARYPSAATDATRAVSSAANRVIDAAKGGFVQRFLTTGLPSFVVDAARGQLDGLSSLLSSLPINPVAEVQAVADFIGRVRSLADNALELVTNPLGMADAILDVIGDIRSVFGGSADAVLGTLRQTYSQPYSGPTGTPSRQQERDNTDALSALVRRAALAEEAKVAVERAQASAEAVADARTAAGSSRTATGGGSAVGAAGVAGAAGATGRTKLFQTREDAIAARNELTDAIDAEMEDPTTTDAEFVELGALRAEVVKGVPAPGLALPRVAELTPPATLPSLVVSHQFYGTAARATEIAERNKARYPGFLPGREPLQVITDG